MSRSTALLLLLAMVMPASPLAAAERLVGRARAIDGDTLVEGIASAVR